jgi:hypothetical protein
MKPVFKQQLYGSIKSHPPIHLESFIDPVAMEGTFCEAPHLPILGAQGDRNGHQAAHQMRNQVERSKGLCL